MPYADPAVVIILVVLSLPIPFRIIRDNWDQLLGRAPEESLQVKARAAVATVLGDDPKLIAKIRMEQIGRFTYLQIYVVCEEGEEADIHRLDACRTAVFEALDGEFSNLALDVIFTCDPRWVGVSVGNGVVSSER